MLVSILREIFGLFSDQLDNYIQGLKNKVWHLVVGLTLWAVAILTIFVALCFFGVSLYISLVHGIGPVLAPLVTGGFFLLVALVLFQVSKKHLDE